MASILSAGTTSGTALNMSGDTSGVLQLATNGTTTALTLDASQRAAFVAGTAALPAITTTGDTNTGIWFPAADTIAFTEGGAEAMRIDSSGNVGIGTTSPATKLDVAGNATVQNGVLTVGKDTVYDAFINTPETMYFNVDSDGNSTGNRFVWGTDRAGNTGGTEWMRIDSSGSLLLGPTSSTGLSGGDFAMKNASSIRFRNAADSAYVSALLFTSSNGLDIGSGGSLATITFGIAGVGEVGRFDSSGNLLVGKTVLNTGNGYQFAPNDGGTGIGGLNITGNSSSNSNNAYLLYSSSASQYQFYVGYGGTISARTTSISALSDQREKTNIRVLETGLAEILALQPRRFDWIDESKKDVAGFIAQEVESILPDLIENYKHDTEDRLALRMGDILPTMVKAIQELKEINDTQAETINALTARIVALESK